MKKRVEAGVLLFEEVSAASILVFRKASQLASKSSISLLRDGHALVHSCCSPDAATVLLLQGRIKNLLLSGGHPGASCISVTLVLFISCRRFACTDERQPHFVRLPFRTVTHLESQAVGIVSPQRQKP
jgi:hypothetical protein